MTNVKNYTDQQILDRVKSVAKGFVDFPYGYWNVYVRSTENEFDRFDDKRYTFFGLKCVQVASCTTNAGKYGLKDFAKYNVEGCAVLQADRIVYDYAKRGQHKGKVDAYRQNQPWPYYRDNDKDALAEELGAIHTDIIGANIHPSSYIKGNSGRTGYIGAWSTACMVDDLTTAFESFMDMTEEQELLTMCILNEW
jgi:hypothetical protein